MEDNPGDGIDPGGMTEMATLVMVYQEMSMTLPTLVMMETVTEHLN